MGQDFSGGPLVEILSFTVEGGGVFNLWWGSSTRAAWCGQKKNGYTLNTRIKHT